MKRKKLYIALGIVLLLAAVAFALMLLPHIPKKSTAEEEIRNELSEYEEESLKADESSEAGLEEELSEFQEKVRQAEDNLISDFEEGGSDENYVSPVDFEKLKEACPDAYAWLSIPGTDISYPLVQSKTDDTYYLKRSASGVSDASGALFTEHTYNSDDMNDPVTVVYGHKMRAGTMFGSLQEEYSKRFDEIKKIIIYMPDKCLKYEAFAAIPYGDQHLLSTFDFEKSGEFKTFFDDILMTRRMGATIDTGAKAKPEYIMPGDKVLVLSTCTYEYDADRFLVMAKLVKRGK